MEQWAPGTGASVAVAHRPSCSTACGILLDQGSNLCPLHWQVDSQPLYHQGSPFLVFKELLQNMYSLSFLSNTCVHICAHMLSFLCFPNFDTFYYSVVTSPSSFWLTFRGSLFLLYFFSQMSSSTFSYVEQFDLLLASPGPCNCIQYSRGLTDSPANRNIFSFRGLGLQTWTYPI